MDLRGFGDSDAAPGDYDSQDAAEDLHQLIAHLGHYAAMEAPGELAKAILGFHHGTDAA